MSIENNQNKNLCEHLLVNQNNIFTNQQLIIQKPQKQKRIYTVIEVVFAWFCILFGYLVCRVSPVVNNTFGGFLFVLLLYIGTVVFALIGGRRLTFSSIIVALSAMIMNISLVVSGNSFLHFFSYTYALVCYCYFLYSVYGKDKKKLLCDYVIVDFIKALFVVPFMSFASLFSAIFSSKTKRGAKLVLKIFLGIVVTTIPTLIILFLLSFDKGFVDIIKKIFDFEIGDIFYHIGSIILGVPIAMYIYSLFISSTDNKAENVLNKISCYKTMSAVKKAPWVTVLASVIPILFLYIVFFVSQWRYYISGFTGVLPKDFDYAQYAREGFFELCVISFINLLIILCIIAFMKNKSTFSSVLLKILCVTFSVFTLVLISTAIAKMVMYIDCYGLTQKRVYASWYMIILVAVFVLIILRQFIKKLKAVAVSLMVVVIMFGALALSNVDEQIANYNVNRYFDGSLKTVDVWTLYELEASAIPSMTRLYEHLDKEEKLSTDEQQMYEELSGILKNKSIEYSTDEPTLFEFNLQNYKAMKLLEEKDF